MRETNHEADFHAGYHRQAVGVSIINGDAQEARAFLQAEYKKWAALIKASGTIIE